MKAICSSETSVTFQRTTRRYTPKNLEPFKLTQSTELSYSWEATSYADAQEFPNILWTQPKGSWPCAKEPFIDPYLGPK
jgi:hypothetical protein